MVLLKTVLFGALAATAAAKSAVIDLIPKNFDDVVLKSGKPTLVEFFAPWCGHCKTLAPVYEELAGVFEHAKDKIQIAKVDADAERDLGKRFGVQGFPTLKYFDGKSDKPEEYNSGRDLESLTEFITQKIGVKAKTKLQAPSEVVELHDNTFKETVGSDKHVLVAFTAPWCGHCKKLAPVWELVAAAFANDENVVIAKVDAEAPNSKAVTAEYGVKSYPTIKFFAAGDKKGVDYDLNRSEAAIIEYINEKAGTHRLPGGELDNTAGTIAVLDALVKKLTGGASLAEVAAEVKKEAGKLKEAAELKYAEYYVRVFDKLSQNEGWVKKESARLDSILTKGGLAPSKRDEIKTKANILKKFVEDVAEKVEKKVEEAKEEL